MQVAAASQSGIEKRGFKTVPIGTVLKPTFPEPNKHGPIYLSQIPANIAS